MEGDERMKIRKEWQIPKGYKYPYFTTKTAMEKLLFFTITSATINWNRLFYIYEKY